MLGAGGFMLRCHKHVYAYLGGGYGEYLKLLKHEMDRCAHPSRKN